MANYCSNCIAFFGNDLDKLEHLRKMMDATFNLSEYGSIRDFVMTGYNTITNFGGAVCLPGDVVFGAGGGVLFIPPHLVEEVVDGGAKTQVKDLFGFEMITQNKFTTAQIDKNTWTEEMLDLLMEFIKTDERAAEYRNLDWSKEYDLARNGDPTDTQSAL